MVTGRNTISLFLVAYTLLVGGILPFHSHMAANAEARLCAASCGHPANPNAHDASHHCLTCQIARHHGKSLLLVPQGLTPAASAQVRPVCAEHAPVGSRVLGTTDSRAPPFSPVSES